MKAEPESRFEHGVDVRFSIDDLASRTEPEPWDGKFTCSLAAICIDLFPFHILSDYQPIQYTYFMLTHM
jgi:hypothetical protein